MKILGISPLDKDATVSIVEDGKILYAAGEERFTRVKQQDGFPHKAMENALAYTDTSIDEIDHVAYAFTDVQAEKKLLIKIFAVKNSLLITSNLKTSAACLPKLTEKNMVIRMRFMA